MSGTGVLRRLFARDCATSDPGRDRGSALDLADIQGFILRGYMMPILRQFLLKVEAPADTRRQLGRLVSGDESDVPQITTAADWHVGLGPGPEDDPPTTVSTDYCLNIGITWPDCWRWRSKNASNAVLQIVQHVVEGAAQRADLVGDIGASAPDHWVGGFGRVKTITSW